MNPKLAQLAAELFPSNTTGMHDLAIGFNDLNDSLLGAQIDSVGFLVDPHDGIFVMRGGMMPSMHGGQKQVVWDLAGQQDELGRYHVKRTEHANLSLSTESAPIIAQQKMGVGDILLDALQSAKSCMSVTDQEKYARYIATQQRAQQDATIVAMGASAMPAPGGNR